ncbi:MAG TPA: class I SAM-dependent DNA methyltransferase [Thiobacillus sp.]|nr:MAG: N-6 DNA methylase [Hydrogenophilales bacterium 16-64-40]OZA35225.1 MAG: N-6 DNA methylase [Hydrogenophilales bacterium 17-64-65]HQS81263.1 class I SAM-dependent DNA methyltransferase [Thiobacillus sp.]HQT32474.1 class I SAM-dependent DNA methyltransferase [Thiobacillus sp.]
MITNQLKNDIDSLWLEFHTGGITNPLTVIEQISFLMFARLLDIEETRFEKLAGRTGKAPHKYFSPDQQSLRWKNWSEYGGEEMLRHVRDLVFPHLRDLGGKDTTFGEYMKDATCLIPKASLLNSAVIKIGLLPLGNSDMKGDLYEYMLSKLSTAGINGQFRTPRHIIRLMVELLDPKPNEVVGDPACGTAGFLVGTMEYLRQKYSSPELVETFEDGSKGYPGDLLEPYREHIQNGLFHGFDFDVTMLRIAAMNLMLHGVENPDIHYQDTLSKNFPERFGKQAEDGFDVILANPPFKGTLDEESVHPSLLRKVKTKKTELLFVALILRMLKNGGRSATIIPDGVLFGSSKAHVALRQHLIDENQLEAVISLPSGVFKPYAGVSTAILVFTKGGRTDEVLLYGVKADGLSLDDRRQPVTGNDLPDALAQFQKWRARKGDFSNRTAKAFAVSVADIRANKYDLSPSRYKESVQEDVKFDPPSVILARMKKLESEIEADMTELEGLLS